MNRVSRLALVLLTAIALTAVAAQSPRRGSTRPPKPTPVATSSIKTTIPTAQPSPTSPTEIAPLTLAIVNDVTVTAADIQEQVNAAVLNDPDPYLRAFYDDREKAIKEARQRALDARISSILAGAEAKKRGLTPEEYLDREVNNRIVPPSDEEIRAAYDANRDQLGNADLESVRPTLVNFLRGQRSEQLYAALVNRLKMTNTVMKHADVNAPNLAPGIVLAAVNGEPIRIEAINERMKVYVYKMEVRIYSAQKQALDKRVNNLLLIAEANKRNIGSEEIFRTEITDKIKPPTEAEISKFYDENKARINRDLASARTSIAGYLEQEQQAKLETALAEKLRAGAKVQVLLKEPEPSVMNVSTGNGPSRGDANAAVTIIEFTDFQCSSCGAMYPVLEDVLKSYGNRVHFVIRDFPLTKLHENALRAAHAASAANAQGKFWEYIDILFKNQSTLDVDSLKKYATQVGLDRKRFDAEFDSGKYDPDIRRDIEDGETYGVEGTPTIFINGVVLTPAEYSADGLRAAIEKAFTRVQKRGQ
ncbi:MAG TPA: thioredoxin domain-containing protein [Pyrinomonadaceae bacterium]|nr:thioredoxin domain-containing protein [Pyrinomonadaceae bacterium]